MVGQQHTYQIKSKKTNHNLTALLLARKNRIHLNTFKRPRLIGLKMERQ